VNREDPLTILVLASEPLVLGSIVLEPGVGREEDKEAAGQYELTNIIEELLGVGQSVY